MMICSTSVIAQQQDIISMQWKVAAALPPAQGQASSLGVAGPISGYLNNHLFIGGGANFPNAMPWMGGKKKYYDELFVYQILTDTIHLSNRNCKLPEPLAYAASVSTPMGVVFAGGENDLGIRKTVYLLQWNDPLNKPEFQSLPDLPTAVTNASAVSVGTKIFLAGGETGQGVSDQLIMLDLQDVLKGWQHMPCIPKTVSHAVFVTTSFHGDTTLFLVGGRSKNANGISDLYNSVYAFSLQQNKWIVKESLPFTLSAGTGAYMHDGKIMLFGGDRGTVFHQAEMLIASIQHESDPLKKQALDADKKLLQSNHPGFCRDILIYDLVDNKWKIGGEIPFPAPVTTTAIQWGRRIFLPSGEVKAGVRSPTILEVKFNP